MLEIFRKQARMSQYRIPKAADKYISEFFSERSKEGDFGNGREARSLLENATVQAAKRISEVPEKKLNVIKDYLHAFRNIEYAVYCSPKDDRNYKIFERVLKLYKSSLLNR